MKSLIIEDQEEKGAAVEGLLNEQFGAQRSEVRRARSLASGRIELGKLQYDLLVLDLMLPVRDGGIPKNQSGADLLEEIVAGDTLIKPTHVICLTEFPDLADVIESEISRSLVHVVLFDGWGGEWRLLLKNKIAYISDRIVCAERSPQEYTTDLAIVTSSPIVELREVLGTSSSFRGEFHSRDALHYYVDDWTRSNGSRVSVVACAAPQMGMTAACVTASKVIERWRPKFLAMTGIAAGTKAGLKFGDILLSEAVFDYGSGKIFDSPSGKRVFVPDPRPLTIDVALKAVLQRCEREQSYVREFMRAWRGQQIDWTPSVRLGVLASGAAVVQSRELVTQILKSSRKVVGLDMEAYGLFHAAVLCPEPRPRVLIAKAVSDFADVEKSDDWQQLAAFCSAQFVHSLFTESEDL